MGYKTDKKRYAKERCCFGNENKPNGFVEYRRTVQEIW